MKKILLLTYSVSPTRGSEYSVAWNYIVNMSKENELYVLFGMSGEHMGDIDEINQYVEKNELPNVYFIPVRPNKIANFFNLLNRSNLFVYTFYYAYQIWHFQAYKKARELVGIHQFDLIHYLCPIGYREPGFLWKLKLPYVWGPIGGTNNFPSELSPALNFSAFLKLGFRSIANSLQIRFKRRVRKAIHSSDIVLTATLQNKAIIDKHFHIDSIYLPENGITTTIIPKNRKVDYSKIKLVWIGSIDGRKSLITLLRAFCLVRDKERFELHVVGDGPLRHELQKFSVDNMIDRYIVWHGKVQRSQVFDIIRNSDLHVITSLTEANTTVIFETLSMGIPTLTLDHCGMRDVITQECGIKIPIQNYPELVNEIATRLNEVVERKIDLDQLSEGAVSRAKLYTWDLRKCFFEKIYDDAICNFKLKRNG